MKLYLGVDGGGTRTTAALVDGEGALLGVGESGPGNVRDIAESELRSHLVEARDRAFVAAGIAVRPADATFLGLAGAGDEHGKEAGHRIASDLYLAPAARLWVDHDLRVAHAGALGGEAGLVLIAGTGAACYGRDGDGREGRAGGMGPMLDDPGSGFDLGRRALIAIVRAADGRGTETSLRAPVLAAIRVSDARGLIDLMRDVSAARPRVAALAEIVLSHEADEVARAIVDHGAGELATMVTAVARQLAMDTPVVAFTGGLSRSATYRDAIARSLATRQPRASLRDAAASPACGAANLARAIDQRA